MRRRHLTTTAISLSLHETAQEKKNLSAEVDVNLIYIGNLPKKVNEEVVWALCSKYGELTSFHVSKRGHAFCSYTSKAATEDFLTHEHELDGRKLIVERAGESAELRLRRLLGGDTPPKITATTENEKKLLRLDLPVELGGGVVIAPAQEAESRKVARAELAQEVLDFVHAREHNKVSDQALQPESAIEEEQVRNKVSEQALKPESAIEGDQVRNKISDQALQPESAIVRNVTVIAHVDHGKSSVADQLLAAAGRLRSDKAGQVQALDSEAEEAKRGITIKSSAVSLDFDKLRLTMIDSPGHADFNNEVASALAVTDGVFLVVDVCEGIRVQTEATLKQAVTCGLGIALVLNKIDRLIIEQRLETSEASNRIRTIIDQVNALLLRLGSSTKLSFAQGNVIFGSAKFAWLASRTTLDALGLNKFGLKAIMAVYLACDDLNGDPAQFLKALESLPDSAFKKMVLAGAESLAKKNTDSILSHGAIIRATLGAAMPAADALLELARTALPSPRDSAPVKARLLMDEELHSAQIRTAVQNSDAKAPAIVLVAKLVALPGTSKQLCGLGRVFAGELSAETRLYEAGKESKKSHKILRLVRFGVREVSSCKRAGPGDVVGIVGLNDDLESPATLTSTLDIAPFRQLNTSVTAKPVVRYAVMLKDQSKRNQLAKALAFLTKTDHAVKMAHTSEKETVIACASSLHASVCEARLNELVGSQSIELRCASVSLAETVTTRSTGPYDGGSCLAKTTNKLNRIYVAAQPLETLELGIELASCKSDKTAILAAAGWTKAKLRKVWAISDSGSLLIDGSSQIPHLAEFKDPAVAAFEQLTKSGPLSGSVVVGVMLIITDALIHAVAAQRRGPALQHAALRAMTAALLTAQPALLEPIYHMEIQLIPRDALRGILDTLRDRDATILDCQDSQIQALVPVVESLSTPNYPDDLTDALKAAARGRLQNPICRLEKWQLVRRRNSKRETELIDHTRNRLGLPRDIRTAESFMDRL